MNNDSEVVEMNSIVRKMIFLSYCHKDESIADNLDNDFRKIGIYLSRDVRELKYKDSIKEFMKKIRTHDYALLIISENYLKSTGCMYEVLELLKDQDCYQRILPIIDDYSIFNKSLYYVRYWQKQINYLKSQMDGLNESDIISSIQHLKLIEQICSIIDEFIHKIRDMKHFSLYEMRETNYECILNYINKN